MGLEPTQGDPASFDSSLVKDLTSGFTRQSVLSTPGMRTANPHENTKQPRLPRLTPLTHPQPVSPLQQQRPLVGDGLRLPDSCKVGDKFFSMHAPLPVGKGPYWSRRLWCRPCLPQRPPSIMCGRFDGSSPLRAATRQISDGNLDLTRLIARPRSYKRFGGPQGSPNRV